MNDIIEKIKNTALFLDSEKEEVIATLPELNQDELDQLEDTIDDFNQSMNALENEYTKNLITEFDTMRKQYNNPNINDGFERFKSGIKKLEDEKKLSSR